MGLTAKSDGVWIELLDGGLLIPEGHRTTIRADGTLAVLGRSGVEVASFGVGEWTSAGLSGPPTLPWWRRLTPRR